MSVHTGQADNLMFNIFKVHEEKEQVFWERQLKLFEKLLTYYPILRIPF